MKVIALAGIPTARKTEGFVGAIERMFITNTALSM